MRPFQLLQSTKKKMALNIFRPWQLERETKVSILDPGRRSSQRLWLKQGEFFKLWNMMELLACEVWHRTNYKESGEMYPPNTFCGIECVPKGQLEDKSVVEISPNPFDTQGEMGMYINMLRCRLAWKTVGMSRTIKKIVNNYLSCKSWTC